MKQPEALTVAVMFALYDAAPSQQALKDAISTMFPGTLLPNTLSSLKQRFARKVQGLKLDNICGLEQLLQSKLFVPTLDKSNIGPDCVKKNITPEILEGRYDNTKGDFGLTNETILELRAYKEKHQYSWKAAYKWMCVLLPTNQHLDEYKIKTSWTAIFQTAAKLKKNKSRNPEAIDSFLSTPYSVLSTEHSTKIKQAISMCPKPNIVYVPCQAWSEGIDSNVAVLQKKNMQQQRVITSLENKVDGLNLCKKENQQLSKDLEISQIGLLKAQQTIAAQKQKNYFKRLNRKEKVLQRKEAEIFEGDAERNCEISKLKDVIMKKVAKSTSMKEKHQETLKALHELKRDRKKLQTSISDQRRRAEKYKRLSTEVESENTDKNSDVAHLKEECRYLQSRVEDHEVITVTDNVYSDEVRQCCVELQACGIAAGNVPKVLKVVSDNLFHHSISKLPSRSSVINFTDEGQVIAKTHVSEALGTCNWDLHTDGTTREGRHIINVAATTSSGQQMSMGYSEVGREDSATLLNVTVNQFKEIAEFHGHSSEDSDSDYICKMMQNLTSLMSDRAAVNKCFNDKLACWRIEMLKAAGEDEHKVQQLNFFYCLAHVLLGFSSETEKVLKQLESTFNKPLGRDATPEFKTWKSNEASTLRTIRTVSEALGPRGDEKSGCRQDWLAFMESQNKPTFLTSYRSNRFNCTFQGAAATSVHVQDIQEFFLSGKDLNRLTRSIQSDVKSEEIRSILHAIGLMWHHFTGPFWDFCHSKVHYLDLYKYISPLKDSLNTLAENPTLAFDQNMASVFPNFINKCNSSLSSGLFGIIEPNNELTKRTLQVLAKGFVNVLERQMSDQLPGGSHFKPASPERWTRTSHSKLTNLVCENYFADLDYSLNQSRNASLHYLSGLHMLKRNNTMQWLKKKSCAARRILWQTARIQRLPLRIKHVLQSKEARSTRMEKMRQNHAKKQALQNKRILQKQIIVQKSTQYGGPVLTKGDVGSITSCIQLSQRQKHQILVNEVKYQKLVLNKPGIKKYGQKETIDSLSVTLFSVLPEGMAQIQIQTAHWHTRLVKSKINHRPKAGSVKRKKKSTSQVSVKRKKKSTSQVSVPLEPAPSADCLHPGLTVAVAYEPDTGNSNWYPGQILTVPGNNTIEVNFLHPKGRGSNQFVWPVPEDHQIIDVNYVISHGFDIQPAGSSGRLWAIPKPTVVQIKSLYDAYCKKYFE